MKQLRHFLLLMAGFLCLAFSVNAQDVTNVESGKFLGANDWGTLASLLNTSEPVFAEEATLENWTREFTGEDQDGSFVRNTWSVEDDASGIKTPFIETWVWGGNGDHLSNEKMYRTIEDLQPGTYVVNLFLRAYNEMAGSSTPSGVKISANDASVDISEGQEFSYNNMAGIYDNFTIVTTVGQDGKLDIAVEVYDSNVSWIAFKNLEIFYLGEDIAPGDDEKYSIYTKSFYSLLEDAKCLTADKHYTTGQAALQKAITTAENNLARIVYVTDPDESESEAMATLNGKVIEITTNLQTAIDAFVLGNKHVDFTEKVLNSSFDIDANNSKTITSWEVINFKQNKRDAANYNTTRIYEDGSAYRINYFVEQWCSSSRSMLDGSGDIHQTLSGLPAGHYRLTADCFAHNQQYNTECEEAVGIQLYANNIVREIGLTGFDDMTAAAFSVDFDIEEDEDVTIGFRYSDTNVNWLGVDNFTLLYIGNPNSGQDPQDGFIEIPQSQGNEYDDFARAELVEGDDYNTYTTTTDLTIAFKMMDVDVKDCDYVVIKFAEPVAAGWNLLFWSNQEMVGVPEGATEYKYVFADDPNCGVTNGILPQISMMTFFGGYTAPLVAKVEGIYKHKINMEPELALEQVGETTVNITSVPNDDYSSKSFSIDMAAIARRLGCAVEDIDSIFAYTADGMLTRDYTANPGFWYDQNGCVTSWGNNARVYIEYADLAEGIYNIGQYAGVYSDITEDVDWKAKFILKYGAKYWTVNVNYTVTAPVDLTQMGETSVGLTAYARPDYLSKRFSVDMEPIFAALGCEADDLTDFYAYTADGTLSNIHTAVDKITNAYGFYFDIDGHIDTWDNHAPVWIQAVDLAAGEFEIGQYPNAITNINNNRIVEWGTQLVLIYEDKSYVIHVDYTISPMLTSSKDDCTLVGTDTLTIEIYANHPNWKWEETSYIDLDYLEEMIGIREDYSIYTDRWESEIYEDGSIVNGGLVWSKEYAQDQKPGFWYGLDIYPDDAKNMVVTNTGYGNGACSFGVAYYSNGMLEWTLNPGVPQAGDSYKANLYFVNETTKEYVKYVLNVSYVTYQRVYATFDNPQNTNTTWDPDTRTFTWSSAWYNQLRNIGLPTGNLTKYKKLVVDCDIIAGEQIRIMFYKDTTNKIFYAQNGVNGFNLQDLFADDLSFLEDCTEICIAGNNMSAPGEAVINEIYLTTVSSGNTIPGDANGDGAVDISDIVAIVNSILGKPSISFNAAAADINGDGGVDITDVVAVVNIILGKRPNNAKAREAVTQSSTLTAMTENGNTNLVVDEAKNFVAMQLDVVMPEGHNLMDVQLNSASNHAMVFNRTGENHYTVLAYSLSNEAFEPTNAALVTLFSDGAEASIEHATFITTEGHRISVDASDMATDIAGISSENQKNAIYNMAGQRMGTSTQSLPAGIYIRNGKKIKVK